MPRSAALLILPLWLVATSCGFNWEPYVDAALQLEKARQAAEMQARSVKATFGPEDPVYLRSRALYEEARSESSRAFVNLSYSIFRKAPQHAVQTIVQDSTTRAQEFMNFAQLSMAQRLAPGSRGPLTSLLKASVIPLVARTFGRATKPEGIQGAVKMIEDAVTWRAWDVIR